MGGIPKDESFRRALIAWLIVFSVTVLLLVIAILPPFVDEPLRGMLMGGFKPFCHQLSDRSFHVAGVQLGVCHRCLGIYSGIPIAIAGFALLRKWDKFLSDKARFVLLGSLVPLAVDWALNFFGIWTNTPVSRLLTGSVFGLVAGYYLAVGIVNIGDASSKADAGAVTNELPVVPGSELKSNELNNA